MKKLFLLVFFLSIFAGTKAQQWDWALQHNVRKFAVDSAGNVFTQNDSTIKKFNSNGTFKWQKQFTGDLLICNLVADNSGNLYIAGSFTNFSIDSMHFISTGYKDIFFCKIDSSGTLLWNKIIGGPNGDSVTDLYLSKQQKILMCGDVGSGATIGTTFFSDDEFFAERYDLNGNLELLIHYLGGNSWEVAGDTSGNIYLLGGININDTLVFGDSVILYGPDNWAPCGDHFIVKFNVSGDFLWAKDFGTNYYAPFQNLGVDNIGNFYLTKWRRYDGFDLTKFDDEGNFIWNHNTGGIYGGCNSLCIDNNDSIWTTGDIWYDPFKGLPFIWEFEPSNNLTGTISATVAASGNNIGNDYKNNIYVSGTFTDTAVFGSTTLLATAGNYFLAKMNRDSNLITSLNKTSENPNSEFLIFPNPSSGIFKVNLKNKTAEAKICINDLLGNCVSNKMSMKNSNHEIDLSSLPKGIYFIEIVSDGERILNKIVLQ